MSKALREKKDKERTIGKIRRVLLVCGIAAALVQIGPDIIGGMLLYPGYSFVSQAISELSAIGAPTRPLLVPFAPIYSAFQVAFGLGIWLHKDHYENNNNGRRQRPWLRALGVTQIIIGIVAISWMPFPMHMRGEETSFTDTMHNAFAAVQVMFILTSLGLGTIAYAKKPFGYYSLGTLVTLVALGSLSFLIAGQVVPQELGNYFGIWERITVYGYMAWVMMLAILLLLGDRKAAEVRT